MARPNLSDSVQLAVYRRELKAYARPRRLLALAPPAAGGVIVLLVRGEGFDALPVGLVVAGWAALVPVIVARGRHHRQRIAEGDID